MLGKKLNELLLVILVFTLSQCDPKQHDTIKLHSNDPFKKTVAKSQIFEIDSRQDNVVEAENGTIIVFPKGSFQNSKGEIIVDPVKIEISEAFSITDMVLSNLTTTSDGKLLETGGMIYFNATSNGEQITINEDVPIHIEIPTLEKKPGMMAYQGVRDENGNMNWINPKPLDNYLSTVDINSLDFLPERFNDVVEKNMPFRKYTTATTSVTDSLYYSLSFSNGRDVFDSMPSNQYNEPYYNKTKKVTKGKYTSKSYSISEADTVLKNQTSRHTSCGVDPAIIKAIKSEKYQNTFIATKEFEARLKVILAEGNSDVLEIYIKNLGKDLYVLDSLAALRCEEQKYYTGYHELYKMSKQRLTNVREADKYSKLLKGYYEKHLTKVKGELEKEKQKTIKALRKKNKEAEKTIAKYKKLLWKREKYRMETYGFTWTNTGWINIDTGTLPKEWSSEPLEITITNGKQFDRVYTYVIYRSIKSLYRLNTADKVEFYAGNDQLKETLMPKNEIAFAVAIGYNNDMPSIAVKGFDTSSEHRFVLSLSSTTPDKVRDLIKKYDQYSIENKIGQDLKFMEKFYKEEMRQKKLQKESEFMKALWKVAFPKCDDGGIEQLYTEELL